MPYGMDQSADYGSPYVRVPGSVSPPMEDKEALLSELAGFQGGGGITSPGQPTSKAGGGWKGGAGMAIAAPLVAALVSKLSGGSMDTGTALAALGGGFLNQKLDQLKTKRQQTVDEENRMMDLAHKSVQGLSKLSQETLAKFPKLQSLSQKYQDALANDGVISPKEASEIAIQYQLAQADMAAASQEMETGTALDRNKQLQLQTQQIQRDAKIDDFAGLMPDADGVGMEDKRGLAREMMYDQSLAQMERETPQKFSINGQQMMGTPSERLRAISEEEQRRHQLKMEEIRERQAQRALGSQGRQEALATFQSDMAEWQQALQAALAAAGDDPDLRAQIINKFRQSQPRKDMYITGGPASKIDRGGLDAIVDKYVGGAATPSSANPPGFPSDGVKFGGRIYTSFAELPPEGQAKLKAHLGIQ